MNLNDLAIIFICDGQLVAIDVERSAVDNIAAGSDVGIDIAL